MSRVLDTELSDELTEAAISAVGEAANEKWKDAALSALRQTCEELREFSVDDVQVKLATMNVSTHEGRAMGAIMLRAARGGLIAPTEKYIKSAQPQCHKNPRRIWRSLLTQ